MSQFYLRRKSCIWRLQCAMQNVLQRHWPLRVHIRCVDTTCIVSSLCKILLICHRCAGRAAGWNPRKCPSTAAGADVKCLGRLHAPPGAIPLSIHTLVKCFASAIRRLYSHSAAGQDHAKLTAAHDGLHSKLFDHGHMRFTSGSLSCLSV